MKFYVAKNTSKKTGKEYIALFAELGYRDIIVSFDVNVIRQVSGLSDEEIYTMPTDVKTYIN